MLTSTAQFTPKWGAQLHRNIHAGLFYFENNE